MTTGELPWWEEVSNCTKRLEKCIAEMKFKKYEFSKLLCSKKDILTGELVEIFKERDPEKTMYITKFLENLSSKELHVLKSKLEKIDTDQETMEMISSILLAEVQDCIYGAIIKEASGYAVMEFI